MGHSDGKIVTLLGVPVLQPQTASCQHTGASWHTQNNWPIMHYLGVAVGGAIGFGATVLGATVLQPQTASFHRSLRPTGKQQPCGSCTLVC
jgi:hypothetical protein